MNLLEARDITKRFGGIVALDGMHFAAKAGEVHAILGENGAGKSTFIQILSGALVADRGKIMLRGKTVTAHGPGAARRAGIAPVFQELSLISDLTVGENIWFGDEALTPLRMISRRALNARTAALFAELGLDGIAPDRLVRSLSIGQQQLVEIAKGLACDPDILILDEATSALVPHEVDWLLDIARRRADAGKLVLYISHRMGEVRRVADRITVLRNGETVGTAETSAIGDDEIVAMMLGRRLNRLFPERHATATDRTALKASGLSVGHQLKGMDFTLREGEVLGVAGLQGHGQRELFMALVGAVRFGGSLEVWGRPVSIRSPRHALSQGIGVALLPEDRRHQGLLLAKPVRENVVLAALSRLTRFGLIDRRAEADVVSESVSRLQIKVGSPEQLAGTLSGGNQQKVVLAKLLATDARILLFFDPTRGVDVGTKAEIFAMMRDLAASGYAILFYSTDIAELVNVADRVMVLSYGRISATLPADQLSEDRILRATMIGQVAA